MEALQGSPVRRIQRSWYSGWSPFSAGIHNWSGYCGLRIIGILFHHCFLVRPIPLPEPSAPQSLEDGDDVQEALLPAQPRYTTLLSDLNSIEDRSVRYTPIDINNSPILLEESWKSLVPLKHLARTLVRGMSTGKYFCTTLIFGYCLVSILLSYSPSA